MSSATQEYNGVSHAVPVVSRMTDLLNQIRDAYILPRPQSGPEISVYLEQQTLLLTEMERNLARLSRASSMDDYKVVIDGRTREMFESFHRDLPPEDVDALYVPAQKRMDLLRGDGYMLRDPDSFLKEIHLMHDFEASFVEGLYKVYCDSLPKDETMPYRHFIRYEPGL